VQQQEKGVGPGQPLRTAQA